MTRSEFLQLKRDGVITARDIYDWSWQHDLESASYLRTDDEIEDYLYEEARYYFEESGYSLRDAITCMKDLVDEYGCADVIDTYDGITIVEDNLDGYIDAFEEEMDAGDCWDDETFFEYDEDESEDEEVEDVMLLFA